jgi:hypothetical protein
MASDIDLFAEGLASEEGTGPFQWFGFTSPDRLRKGYEENGLLGPDGGVLTVIEKGELVGRVEGSRRRGGDRTRRRAGQSPSDSLPAPEGGA